MRQLNPPPPARFYLCLACDRGEWRAIADENRSPIDHRHSSLPPCSHCGGAIEERFPHTIPFTREQRRILKSIACHRQQPVDAILGDLLAREFRRQTTARSAQGKPVPQWAADWLQQHKEV